MDPKVTNSPDHASLCCGWEKVLIYFFPRLPWLLKSSWRGGIAQPIIYHIVIALLTKDRAPSLSPSYPKRNKFVPEHCQLGWIIFSKVAYFFPASCLSHYTIFGEIPPKKSGQSEVVKGSTKDSEISG